jgi:hypothetical protein
VTCRRASDGDYVGERRRSAELWRAHRSRARGLGWTRSLVRDGEGDATESSRSPNRSVRQRSCRTARRGSWRRRGSGERTRMTQGVRENTSGTYGLHTSLQFSGRSPCRRKGGRTGDRRWRLGFVELRGGARVSDFGGRKAARREAAAFYRPRDAALACGPGRGAARARGAVRTRAASGSVRRRKEGDDGWGPLVSGRGEVRRGRAVMGRKGLLGRKLKGDTWIRRGVRGASLDFQF